MERTLRIMGTEVVYLHGHEPEELDRLARQDRLVGPITREGLVRAGIGPGMRVLDVGTGAGDVAFLAANLVGSSGQVIGADRSQEALESASRRAAELGLPNVTFELGDPAELRFDEPFDAVIGRYVLMFQPDPAGMLRSLLQLLKPGGIAAFHEPDWEGALSLPACPTYDRCCQWLRQTVVRSGARDRMGAELPRLFRQAGLPTPELHAGALLGAGEHAEAPLRLLADLVARLIPEFERYGVATAGEVGAEGLYERMLVEAAERAATIVCRTEIVAFACRGAA
jgi:SAM-dependent methyltransferase